MPRIARIYIEEGVFHILSRGNNKQAVFHDKCDFEYYKIVLRKLREEHPLKLYHWSLMSNHVHLIVETNPKTELSKLMKRLNLAYYAYYKRKYDYAGHFWQDRFKTLLIDKDDYLLACGLYIERNPVRAGIVGGSDYPHSSFKFYTHNCDDNLTDRSSLYDELGRDIISRREAYKKLTLDTQLNITGDIFKSLFLGSEEYIRRMENKFNVANIRAVKGRPVRE